MFRSPPHLPETAEADPEVEELIGSLDRSRKRHLTPGLLRGDQSVDRLSAQEVSASPILKKSNLTGKMALTMSDFQAYMDENVSGKLREVGSNITVLKDDMASVITNVQRNSQKLDKLAAEISSNKKGLEALE